MRCHPPHATDTSPILVGPAAGQAQLVDVEPGLDRAELKRAEPDADPATRVDLDTQVRATGVDPDQVRAQHEQHAWTDLPDEQQAWTEPLDEQREPQEWAPPPEEQHQPYPDATQPDPVVRSAEETTGRAPHRVQHEGVWQQGSPEAAKAGLSYTRTPGRTITPGRLAPQQDSPAPARTAAKTREMGR